MISDGLYFIAAIMDSKDGVKDIASSDIQDDELLESELEIYTALRGFSMKHGKVPSLSALEEMVPDVILPEALDPPSYYAEKVRKRFKYRALTTAIQDAAEYLSVKANSFNPDAALDIIQKAVVDLLFRGHQGQIADFRDAYTVVFEEYKKVMAGTNEKVLLTGWPSFDEQTGGITYDDILSIIGRPAQGKTYLGLKMMHHAWKYQSKTPMFVSMEMSTTPLIQRMAAMHTHFNISKLKKGEFSSKKKEVILHQLQGLKSYDKPMWIVDGAMAATVEDIWALAQQLNPDCIFIDGAYMMGHKNKRLTKWDRIGENADSIKRILAKELTVPVVASYQFGKQVGKDAKKAKKSADIPQGTIDDVYGSDVVAQVSSLMIGLMQQPGVETMKHKDVSILKGREGGTGSFAINWDFSNMNFDEKEEGKTTEQMMYL